MSTDSTISPEKRKQLQQLFVRGNEQMAKEGYDYANFYFSECVLQDPENPIYAQTFLANLKKKFGDKKNTTSSFIAAGKKMTVHSKNSESLLKVCVEMLASNPWHIESLISAGRACEGLGHLKSAIIYYQTAVETDPHHIGANTVCCEALRANTDFDGAIACVQRILKQKPDDRDVRKLLHDLSAEKTIHKGKYATGASRDEVESAGSIVPDDEDAMGRTLTVEAQIKRRIAKNPQDTANYVELAQWYFNQTNLEKAEECYKRAVEVSDNNSGMIERLLEVQKKRLHAEALRLKEEYERHPQEDRKSVFLACRSRYEAKSIELAQHRLKHYPNHAGYRYDYGVLLQNSEQVNEAIAEFQIAKADKSLAGKCLLALGQCFQMIRQYKLAMTHYQEAISVLEPGETKKKALYLAMKLAFTLEDYVRAEEYGHQLAAMDFSYRDLGDVLNQIAQRRTVPQQT